MKITLRFIWLEEFNLDENIILHFVNNSLEWTELSYKSTIRNSKSR